MQAVLHSTFKEARNELDHLLFRDEKTRDLENQVLLATGILRFFYRCWAKSKMFVGNEGRWLVEIDTAIF